MILIITILLAIIFFSLSGIHVYWLFGGQRGLEASIPVTVENEKLFMPSKFATFLVAFILFFFAMIIIFKTYSSGEIENKWIQFLMKYSLSFIAILFIVRAIGDFQYVGFFKKIKHSLFAEYDTNYFSPLCLIIGILAILLQYMLK